MGIYTHKDVVFEANQLLFNNINNIKEWCGAKYSLGPKDAIVGLYINLGNIIMLARLTDYIMKSHDKFVIIPQDIFEDHFLELHPNNKVVELLDDEFDDELPDLVQAKDGNYLRWDSEFYYFKGNE